MKAARFFNEGFVMGRLSLSLLGGFHAELNGEPVTTFESNKVRALLAYLMVEADRVHQRSMLAGLLWPDHTEAEARTNLRHVLRQLRQSLSDHAASVPLLMTSKQTVQINPTSDFHARRGSLSGIAGCLRAL